MAFVLESCHLSHTTSSNKQVRFGNVEQFEYLKVEEKKITMKRKVQGFFETIDDCTWKITNDQHLKILIKNQIF